MDDHDPIEDPQIDRWVKEHLEQQATRVDAAGLIGRMRAARESMEALPSAAPDPLVLEAAVPKRRAEHHLKRTSLAWFAATAAGFLLALVVGRVLEPASANAALILRDVRAVHAGDIDRCYQVQYAPDQRYWNVDQPLEGPSQSVLWTRGRQFRADCHIGKLHLLMGRGEKDDFWISPSRNKGIRFEGDSARWPEQVALICSINSMNVTDLLGEVLADFDLSIEAQTKSGKPYHVVWASLKPGRSHTLLSNAMLEIDSANNTLLRMVLWTTKNGSPKGTATYTLVDSTSGDDAMYQLESHLDADAEIQTQVFKPVTAAWESKP